MNPYGQMNPNSMGEGGNESNLWLLLQALPGCVPVSLILVFLPDFLVTQFGMSIAGTLLVQLVFGVSGMIFSFLGGIL